MIVRLTGKLLEKHPDHVVIDAQGVGYQCWITLNTFEQLPPEGQAISLATHLQVREDSHDLFGFSSTAEKAIFLQLISVSGIGAKTAISLLSGAQPDEFRRRIYEADEKALTSMRGIGPKMARRLITELSEKLGSSVLSPDGAFAHGSRSPAAVQAVQSLVALGYKQAEAQRSVNKALQSSDPDTPVENLIRAALNARA